MECIHNVPCEHFSHVVVSKWFSVLCCQVKTSLLSSHSNEDLLKTFYSSHRNVYLCGWKIVFLWSWRNNKPRRAKRCVRIFFRKALQTDGRTYALVEMQGCIYKGRRQYYKSHGNASSHLILLLSSHFVNTNFSSIIVYPPFHDWSHPDASK